jgi:Bax protein
MMMKFEHGAIGLVATLVAVLIGVSFARPPAGATATASFGHLDRGPGPARMDEALARAKGARTKSGGGKSVFSKSPKSSKSSKSPVSKVSKVLPRGLDYDLAAVGAGKKAVPRLILASLPENLAGVRENSRRKAFFFKAVLPLILQVNEETLKDRRRLWSLRYKASLGQPLSATDRIWLAMMSERYKDKKTKGGVAGKLARLLVKVDIIPPSLALAQAAEESGWGGSRFAREGNAIYGQWTWNSENGLTPLEREDGKTHKIRVFPSILDSVRAYVRNLNTHRSYRGLRLARAALRRIGAPLDGMVLAGRLGSYSVRGSKYVKTIRALIDANKLRRLDDARLQDGKAQDLLI